MKPGNDYFDFKTYCTEKGLPIESVIENTDGFIKAIIDLPNEKDKIFIRNLIAKYPGRDFLFLYLKVRKELVGELAQITADKVNKGLDEAMIPFA